MFSIVRKKNLNLSTCLLEILAPQIAKAAKPGQFIVLRIDETGERIPLTIYDFDKKAGTISLVAQKVGKTTNKLCLLKKNDHLIDLAGPLEGRQSSPITKKFCLSAEEWGRLKSILLPGHLRKRGLV